VVGVVAAGILVVVGVIGVVWWTLDRDTPGDRIGTVRTDEAELQRQNTALRALDRELDADPLPDSEQSSVQEETCDWAGSGSTTYGPWLTVSWNDATEGEVVGFLQEHDWKPVDGPAPTFARTVERVRLRAVLLPSARPVEPGEPVDETTTTTTEPTDEAAADPSETRSVHIRPAEQPCRMVKD
jgi:hypothetical protein